MANIDLSKAPYGDQFKESNRFSKVLFRPGRPALAQELLETQSMIDNQINLLGQTLFTEGSIISGMSITPIPSGESVEQTNLANSFSTSSLDAVKASVNIDDYSANGNLNVSTQATLKTDQPQVKFNGTSTVGMSMTLDFFVRRTTGSLNKIAISYDTNILEPSSYTIDGDNIATPLNDMSANHITTQGGSQVNLNDGTLHHVQVVFKTLKSGNPQFSLFINPNSDSSSNPVTMVINKLYIHDGKDTSMTWVINPQDGKLASSTLRNQQYHVSPGKIWLAGAVREFDGGDISIKGVGDETIGVQYNENIVTSEQDQNLLDQSQGTSTHGMAGADRLQYTLTLTYNNGLDAANGSVPIITFKDNVINQKAIKPDYSQISAILAKRTFDINGSFRVGGFDAHTGDYPLDDSKIKLDIDAGNAYVRGYNITTTETKSILLDKSTTTAKVQDEQLMYSASTNSAIQLNNQPVQRIENVSAQLQATNNSVARSTGSDTDVFTNENAYQIIQVRQNSTTYQEGKDFSRSGNNSIRWGYNANGDKLLNAQVPNGGTSYSVTYRYSKNLTEDTDYKVIKKPNTEVTCLDFKDCSGVKPIDNSNLTITYDYFQARIDMIMITQDQENPFAVIKGTPDALGLVKPPVVKDDTQLELGYVLIYPNSENAQFVMDTITNLPFSDIQNLARRVDNLEYNSAIYDMYNTVQQNEDPLTSRNSFAESFTTFEKADTSYLSNNDPNSGDSWGVAFNVDDASATLASKAEKIIYPDIDESNSSYDLHGDLLVSPYTDKYEVGQQLVTGVVNVNEYQVFAINGYLSISPNSDTWTDTQHNMIQTESGDVKHVDVNVFWRHMSSIEDLRTHFNNDTMQYFGQIQGIDWSDDSQIYDGATRTGYIMSSQGSTTTETLIEYMRSRDVEFTASNFLAYQDGGEITIAGVPVQNPTPASDQYKGSQGKFKTDGQGNVKGKFTIPGGTIHCGTQPVVIRFPDGSIASTTYTATGTMITTTDIINRQEVVANIVDPLAQSFNVAQTCYLSRIKLWFNKKPGASDSTHNNNLEVQIRELTDGGNPSRKVAARTFLSPQDINISDDASVATDIVFDNLVQLHYDHGYCVVLVSDSDEYEVFRAKRGESITNGDHHVIQGAPNPNGVMFTSNNAQTWVADPNSSLKFEVYSAQFNSNGLVQFDPIDLTAINMISVETGQQVNDSMSNIDKLALATVQLTNGNTGCSWEYRLMPLNSDVWGEWTPIAPINNNMVTVSPTQNTEDRMKVWEDLLEQSSKLQLRASFKSDYGVTPIVSKPNISFKGLLTKNSGSYIGVNTTQPTDSSGSGGASFDHVKMQYDAEIPDGCKVTPYYSIDGGQSWKTLNNDGTSEATPKSVQNVGIKYKRYIFEADVPGVTDKYHCATQFKAKLKLDAPNNFTTPTVKKLLCLMSNKNHH